ncbi:TonB-dependent siderophore receptor [Rubritalea spongiae]
MRHALLFTTCIASTISSTEAQEAPSESNSPDDSLAPTTIIAESPDIETTTSPYGKILSPITEIPRSIDIITRKQFEERGALNVQDSLGYTAGVFAGPFGFDTRLDDSKIRGINPLNFQDGFQSHFRFYNTTRPEIYGTESVEVIKGASSILYGQGALGGIVNTISKLPQETAQREINLQYGSHDRRQAAFDFTGPIGESGNFFYRLVGLVRESGTQVDWVNDDALMLMPSITWKPSDDTSLTLLASFQDNNGGSSIQFYDAADPQIASVNIDSDDFFGQPGWDKYDSKQSAFSLFFDHKINDIFSFNTNARYSQGSVDYRYVQALPSSLTGSFGLPNPQAGSLYGATYRDESSSDIWSVNSSIVADFTTGNLEHKAVFGIDYVEAVTDSNRPTSELGTDLRGYNVLWGGTPFFSLPQTINFADPAYDLSISDLPYDQRISQRITQVGLRLSDVIKHKNWIFSLGARYDTVDQKHDRNYDIAGLPLDKSSSDSAFSFDGGVMYQFSNGITPYYSYSEAFEAQDVDFTTGKSFDPRTGRQHEIGLKYRPSNSNTLLTFAMFDIEESNRLVSANGVSNTPVDASYQGAELEIQHRWHDFYFQGALTLMQTETGDEWSSDPTIGDKLPNIPDQQASAWVTYAPEAGKLENFRSGLGIRYIGETYSPSNSLNTDDQTLVDAMIGYRIGDIDLQLNATNLFDKEYVAGYSEGATGQGQFWGSRRFVNLSATYHF